MDRGKPGSKMHILSDANGLPLLVGVSAANTHDSEGLKPMIEGHQTRHDPHRGRYFKPQRLHADKAYDRPDLRRWLRWKRIGVRIARKGIESSERLGRRRWVIERTMSWLSGYRRLSPRYERHPRNYLAFLGLAAAICCYKRLVRLTTWDTLLDVISLGQSAETYEGRGDGCEGKEVFRLSLVAAMQAAAAG